MVPWSEIKIGSNLLVVRIDMPVRAHLLAAVSTNDIDLLKVALNRPHSEEDMAGLIDIACMCGMNSMLKELLIAGVKPCTCALWEACMAGHRSIVELLHHEGLMITQNEIDMALRHGHHVLAKQLSELP